MDAVSGLYTTSDLYMIFCTMYIITPVLSVCTYMILPLLCICRGGKIGLPDDSEARCATARWRVAGRLRDRASDGGQQAEHLQVYRSMTCHYNTPSNSKIYTDDHSSVNNCNHTLPALDHTCTMYISQLHYKYYMYTVVITSPLHVQHVHCSHYIPLHVLHVPSL